MAIFGSLGKALGLGTAQSFVTELTGSPLAGRVAGATSKGISDITRRRAMTEQGQSTAVSVAPPPAETAFSGELGPVSNGAMRGMQYGAGIQPAAFRGPAPSAPGRDGIQRAGLPAVIAGGGALATTAGRMLMFGGGAIAVAPIIMDPFTGEEKKLRVTRRLRSQVKRAVEMFGVEAVADQMGTDVEVIFYILTKKMRNDGPYVTKAAVRKTRQTMRKLKTLCDMHDDMRPAARRRAPVRKSATTRITNVK